jgi:hypothetical protein
LLYTVHSFASVNISAEFNIPVVQYQASKVLNPLISSDELAKITLFRKQKTDYFISQIVYFNALTRYGENLVITRQQKGGV